MILDSHAKQALNVCPYVLFSRNQMFVCVCAFLYVVAFDVYLHYDSAMIIIIPHMYCLICVSYWLFWIT
jgi:hypothetical protein